MFLLRGEVRPGELVHVPEPVCKAGRSSTLSRSGREIGLPWLSGTFSLLDVRRGIFMHSTEKAWL